MDCDLVASAIGYSLDQRGVRMTRDDNEALRRENERLTKANEKLTEINVGNLIKINQLRDAHQKVLDWVGVINQSYRDEFEAKANRADAHRNIEKICNQWLKEDALRRE